MIGRSSFVTCRTIGQGGGGIVLEVWPGPVSSESVALKYLLPESLQHREVVRRFRREVEILRRLDHPSIVSVLDADLDADEPWFTMPLADRSLADEVSHGKMNDARIEEIIRQLLDAITYAHDSGVVHRDLKPENVLIYDDRVVVADFGLGMLSDATSGTLTSLNTGRGTHGYAAPEQFEDFHSADHRADIYAIGTLLYKLSTGRSPIGLDPRSAPDMYRRIIVRCREHAPKDRYQSAQELHNALMGVWHPEDDLIPSAARARALAVDVSSDAVAREEFTALLVSHLDDVELYMTAPGELDAEAVQSLAESHPGELLLIVKNYDSIRPLGFPFEWVDSAALFLERVFTSSDDEVTREAALTMLLRLSNRAHRFNGGRIFSRIVHSSRSRPNVEIVRDVMLANPHEVQWAAKWIDRSKLSHGMQQTLDQVIRQAEIETEAMDPDDEELLDYILQREA